MFSKIKSLLFNKTVLMGAGTFTSRIMGQLRSILLVLAIGGATLSANAFDIANSVPNILLAVISGGFLNSILVPQIVSAFKKDDRDERLSKLLTFSILAIFIFTVIVTIASPLLIDLMASSNWTVAQKSLATSFAYICIPQLFFYGLYTLLGQFLASKEKFTGYFWAPIVNNIVTIIGLIIFIRLFQSSYQSGSGFIEFWTMDKIILFAGTATLGIVCQALVLIPPVLKLGINFRPIFSMKGFGLGKLFKLAIWSFLIIVLENAVTILFTNITSAAPNLSTDPSSVGGNYAFNLGLIIMVVPTSIFTVSINTRVFTKISHYFEAKDGENFIASLTKGIKQIIRFEIFSMILFLLLSQAVTIVLVPTADKVTVNTVSSVILCHVIAFGWVGTFYLMRKVYFVLENSKKAFLICIPNAIVVLLGVLFTWNIVPPEAFAGSISLFSSLGSIVSAIFTYTIIGKDIRLAFAKKDIDTSNLYFDKVNISLTIIKTIIASCLAIIFGFVAKVIVQSFQTCSNIDTCLLPNHPAVALWITSFQMCLIVAIIVSAIYFGSLKLLRA